MICDAVIEDRDERQVSLFTGAGATDVKVMGEPAHTEKEMEHACRRERVET